MINIKIIDGWGIKSDSYQYILVRKKGDREFVEGYYSTIESCLQALIDRKIRDLDCDSISSLIQSIKSLQTALNRALQPLHLEVHPTTRLESSQSVFNSP